MQIIFRLGAGFVITATANYLLIIVLGIMERQAFSANLPVTVNSTHAAAPTHAPKTTPSMTQAPLLLFDALLVWSQFYGNLLTGKQGGPAADPFYTQHLDTDYHWSSATEG